jgi:hypothetical protein
MADYYSLLSRAVSNLPRGSPPSARRAIYGLARKALIGQLRSLKPALPESDIAREENALDAAVSRLEAEFEPPLVTPEISKTEDPPVRRKLPASDDYYSLLSRAVANLPKPSPVSARREIYDKLNKALANQLGTLNPPLSGDEITQQEGHFQSAIEELEGEFPPDEPISEPPEEPIPEPPEEPLPEPPEEPIPESAKPPKLPEPEDTIYPNDKLLVRAKLAEMASPEPSLTPDGRLTAGANTVYDSPNSDDDLLNLPIRQQAVIETVLIGLPRNAPKQLFACLKNYDDELKVRGVRPIIGLLRDMADIIKTDVGTANAAREWLEEGMLKAFDIFLKNHELFMQYFPLDLSREQFYSSIHIDESKIRGTSLTKPFDAVAKAARNANEAGVTTDDFLKIVDKLAEFARVVSTQLPLTAVSTASATSPKDTSPISAVPLVAQPADTISQVAVAVSTRKRVLLSGLGFFERVYNILGSTASLMGLPTSNALLSELHDALSALSHLIGL